MSDRSTTRTWVYHPFLFAAFPVLFLFSRSIAEQVTFGDMLRPLLIVVAITAVLLAALTPLLRSSHRAGLVVSALAIVFFTYGHLSLLLRGRTLLGLPLGSHRFLLPLAVGLLVMVVILTIRRGRSYPRLTSGLNFVAAGLLVINVFSVVQAGLTGRPDPDRPLTALDREVRAAPREPVGGPKRDVYYLIFDRYAGAETLEKYYDYDNAPFLDGLRDRGFFVPQETWANYPRTARSLGASMSMDYLTAIEPITSSRQFYGLLDRPRAAGFFEERGYTTINIGSWWEVTEEDPGADINIAYGSTSQFDDKLLEGTLAGAFQEQIGGGLSFRRREYGRVPFQFAALKGIARMPEPTFTFAHFLLPHEPFIWDADGSFLPRPKTRHRSQVENYTNHVTFANREILELIDVLQSVPEERQPIIIVQSDEGPEPLDAVGDYIQAWAQATTEQREQKLRILNSYSFPGLEETSLYEEISPVNTFRVLLNDYFDAGLPLLPDRTYLDTHSTRDATAELRAL